MEWRTTGLGVDGLRQGLFERVGHTEHYPVMSGHERKAREDAQDSRFVFTKLGSPARPTEPFFAVLIAPGSVWRDADGQKGPAGGRGHPNPFH